MSMSESFDFDWRFARGDCEGAAFAEGGFDDSSWERVDLPHDWSIEGPFSRENPAGGSGAWAPAGVAWYRRRFAVPSGSGASLCRLEFDGVYRRSRVYLDGELVGKHDFGYSSFAIELPRSLEGGSEHLVALRADNSDQPNCRWYSGSGIYRRARIVYHDALRIEPWGLSATTPLVSARRSRLRAAATVFNGLDSDASFEVEASVAAPDGREMCRITRTFHAAAGASVDCGLDLAVGRPELWSTEEPRLYLLRARLLRGGRELDEARARIGFRRAEFRGGRGFFLNGRAMKLKGVCLHGDAGAVGAAVPVALWRRRLGLLKDIGCNAIRCSHNPPDPQFLDLCDELGFLVIDEVFDKWVGDLLPKEQWFMRQVGFEEVWKETLEASIRRDRNHPSVILWSVGNETGQPGTDEVDPWLGRLCDAARAIDPTRPVTAAFVHSTDPDPAKAALKVMRSAEKVDVLCVNYQEPFFARYHAVDPKKAIIGSETFLHWRGIESSVHAFGLKNPWFDVAENDFVAGQFLWPGIDYLGESPRWPLKGWDVGLFDTTGRLKAGGQFHRSAWSDRPMVALAVRDHGLGKGETALSWGGYSLSAHWNWPELACEARWPELAGRLVEVEAQTNCETVELFLNGQSYGEKATADFVNGAVLFLVPYQPGILRAVGRRRGAEAAAAELATAGPAAALRLKPEREAIAADGYDAVCVGIELVDAEGRVVPREDRPISVTVAGPGKLLGLDNGVLNSDEPYATGRRSTSGGYCLAIVGRSREAGRIELRAACEGLEATARLEARAP